MIALYAFGAILLAISEIGKGPFKEYFPEDFWKINLVFSAVISIGLVFWNNQKSRLDWGERLSLRENGFDFATIFVFLFLVNRVFYAF